MNNPAVQGESWFQATIRWAVMVEGRGLRDWEEAVYLFRSEDYDSAFQRALAIGEGGQSGGGGRHPASAMGGNQAGRGGDAGLPG